MQLLEREKSDLIRQALLLEQELEARKCLEDKWYWLRFGTKTKDEQDIENPYKPFPNYEAIPLVFDVLDREDLVFILKSRTVMGTWSVCGWTAHYGFNRPATTVVYQSQDWDKSLKCIEYVKILWENSLDLLKKRWKLRKPLDTQPFDRLDLANGSKFIAIPGQPDKIRSEHPTIVVLDEAAHIPNGEESFDIAVATRCPKMICLSSAAPAPNWYDAIYKSSRVAEWPLE